MRGQIVSAMYAKTVYDAEECSIMTTLSLQSPLLFPFLFNTFWLLDPLQL